MAGQKIRTSLTDEPPAALACGRTEPTTSQPLLASARERLRPKPRSAPTQNVTRSVVFRALTIELSDWSHSLTTRTVRFMLMSGGTAGTYDGDV